MDEQADNMPTATNTAQDDSAVAFSQPLQGTLVDFIT